MSRYRQTMREALEKMYEDSDAKSMYSKQTEFIKYAADEMNQWLMTGAELPEWFKSKLSAAHSEIRSLHSYMEGDKRDDDGVNDVKENNAFRNKDIKSQEKHISDYLTKKGFNPKDAEAMTKKHLPYVSKQYPTATTAKMASLISLASANESYNEETDIEEVTAKKAGYLSHKFGRKLDQNPHPKDSQDYKDWEAGWKSVKEEVIQEGDSDKDGEADGVEIAKIRKSRDKYDGDHEKERMEKELVAREGEIQRLRNQIETMKAQSIKKDTEKLTNPETGEPLLQVGVAYKALKDKMKKEEVDEATLTQLDKLKDSGADADEIAKKLKINIKFVKDILGENLEEERGFIVVHAKKGKIEVYANSSYEAAKKAAAKWGLSSTAGIDAHLAEETELEEKFVVTYRHKATGAKMKSTVSTYATAQMSARMLKAQGHRAIEIIEEEVNEGLSPLSKGTQNHIARVQDADAKRLEKLRAAKREKNPSFIDKLKKGFKSEDVEWDEERMDIIGQNGNNGEHYEELEEGYFKAKIKDRMGNVHIIDTKGYLKSSGGVLLSLDNLSYLRPDKFLKMGSAERRDKMRYFVRLAAGDAKSNKDFADKLNRVIQPWSGKGKFYAEEVELQEKLKVSDGLGAWIDDFVKSDAPQFDGKSKEKRKDMAIAAFTSAGGKLEQKEHPAKAMFESIAAVKKKADETGMPYSVLKQVYDRGMAAWRGGHRPGATQVQWALARVNSFVTKSSGTWGGADKDLAAKVKGEK